jgi:hypothetical protein
VGLSGQTVFRENIRIFKAMHTGALTDAIDDLYFFSEILRKSLSHHFLDRSETMNIKKLFIRESLLFITYMLFGFLIFPAGL